MQDSTKFAYLSLSGGLDSTTLLLHLLARGYQVTAISFLYGQKHNIEIERAQDLIQYLNLKGFAIKHHIIHLNGLSNLLFSALVEGGNTVPEGLYSGENMAATVVPNRNKIFISILQAAALSCAIENNTTVHVALGIHAGDHAVYPDCRPEFIDADYQAFQLGNWHAEKVAPYMPYLNADKGGILQDGIKACKQLNLDFKEIYKRTITSYKPNTDGISDYKSASSIQRIAAFIKLNCIDPIIYADDRGIVDWETVKAHVLSVLDTADKQK
ncbi:transcriptional regulator ExsB [Legionella beliardensis]|uniref:7-cyano-7-deazaguanine synthase n=1 Tax=Legionella beliardensis TaxID=91822 RepID=A0A378HY26_9GAMM|nr:transcriptional regulator ExsB [Legionella beliardensis]